MKQGVEFKLGVWAAVVVLGTSVSFGAPMGAGVFFPAPESRYEVAARLALPVPAPARPQAPVLDQRLIADLLVDSIVQIESGGNPRTVGSKGERGLMQIKADTWGEVTRQVFGARVSFSRAFEADLNRTVGASYLAQLQTFLHRHRAQWKADERSLLLACYNAGPERVRRSGFDLRRLPASTQDYVKRGGALHDSFLVEHNISTRQVRLAMDATRRPGGA